VPDRYETELGAAQALQTQMAGYATYLRPLGFNPGGSAQLVPGPFPLGDVTDNFQRSFAVEIYPAKPVTTIGSEPFFTQGVIFYNLRERRRSAQTSVATVPSYSDEQLSLGRLFISRPVQQGLVIASGATVAAIVTVVAAVTLRSSLASAYAF
jgi:hypothetical protein